MYSFRIIHLRGLRGIFIAIQAIQYSVRHISTYYVYHCLSMTHNFQFVNAPSWNLCHISHDCCMSIFIGRRKVSGGRWPTWDVGSQFATWCLAGKRSSKWNQVLSKYSPHGFLWVKVASLSAKRVPWGLGKWMLCLLEMDVYFKLWYVLRGNYCTVHICLVSTSNLF